MWKVTLVVKIVLKFAAVAKRPRVRTVELYASTVVKKPNAIVVSMIVMIVRESYVLTIERNVIIMTVERIHQQVNVLAVLISLNR